MIIECDNCNSSFKLDGNLIKEEGSKVRCSVCQQVFTAYPQETSAVKGPEPVSALSSSSTPPEAGDERLGDVKESGFDLAFEEVMEEAVTESIQPEEMPDHGKAAHMGEGVDQLELEDVEAVEDEPQKTKVKKSKERRKSSKGMKPSKKRGGLRFAPLILVIIFLLLVGAGAVFYFAPDFIPESFSFLKPQTKQEITDLGIRRLSFKGVNGAFVDSENNGQFFVIRGMVKNEYTKSRSFILIKGAILDEKGQVVKQEMAYAGNTLTENQIKEMAVDSIHKAQRNRLGNGNVNVDIMPGASIPFMIILADLPENLSEFTVEAVSSTRGN